MSLYLAMAAHSAATWRASSRVGARAMAAGLRWPAGMPSTIGMQNAAVLPVPVLDRTTRSRPARAGSIAAAWTPVATV